MVPAPAFGSLLGTRLIVSRLYHSVGRASWRTRQHAVSFTSAQSGENVVELVQAVAEGLSAIGDVNEILEMVHGEVNIGHDRKKCGCYRDSTETERWSDFSCHFYLQLSPVTIDTFAELSFLVLIAVDVSWKWSWW